MAFVGHDNIAYIKRTIDGDRRLGALIPPFALPICNKTCSSDEGYGELCVVVNASPEPERFINFIYMTHQSCWKSATSRIATDEADLTTRELELVSLAHRTRAIPASTEGNTRNRVTRSRLALGIWDSAVATPLGLLLTKISKLPQELVDMVLVYLDGTVVASLLKTHQTLVDMPPKTISIRIQNFGPICSATYLSARMNSLLGETYLCGLSRGREPKTDGSVSIPIVNHKRMTGFQVAVSTFGLRALCILYADDSTSPWLGSPANCWLGIVQGTWWTTWEVLSDVCA